MCSGTCERYLAFELYRSVGRQVVACHINHWNEGSYGKHCVGVLAAVVDDTIGISIPLHSFNTSFHQFKK